MTLVWIVIAVTMSLTSFYLGTTWRVGHERKRAASNYTYARKAAESAMSTGFTSISPESQQEGIFSILQLPTSLQDAATERLDAYEKGIVDSILSVKNTLDSAEQVDQSKHSSSFDYDHHAEQLRLKAQSVMSKIDNRTRSLKDIAKQVKALSTPVLKERLRLIVEDIESYELTIDEKRRKKDSLYVSDKFQRFIATTRRLRDEATTVDSLLNNEASDNGEVGLLIDELERQSNRMHEAHMTYDPLLRLAYRLRIPPNRSKSYRFGNPYYDD